MADEGRRQPECGGDRVKAKWMVENEQDGHCSRKTQRSSQKHHRKRRERSHLKHDSHEHERQHDGKYLCKRHIRLGGFFWVTGHFNAVVVGQLGDKRLELLQDLHRYIRCLKGLVVITAHFHGGSAIPALQDWVLIANLKSSHLKEGNRTTVVTAKSERVQ